MLRAIGLTVLVVTSAACCSRTPTPTAEVKGGNAAVEPAAPDAPMLAHWVPVSDSGGRLVLDAVVIRRGGLAVPVNVRIEVPEGLVQVAGPVHYKLEPDPQAARSTVRYEFQYSGAPPAQDLVLVAEAGGAGMGVHAKDAYRFGREPTLPKVPEPSGPGVKFGDRELGPSIPIEPKAK